MIIGLTGTLASGKGTIADFLKKRGYVYFSCSDIIREELEKIGKEEDITSLVSLGNQIRTQYGKGELAKRIINKIIENKIENAVVDSIRHPDEVKELKKLKNFILVVVDAPIGLRYERIKFRQRKGDDITFEQFKTEEEKQMKGINENSQDLGECMRLADYRLINDGTIERLKEELESILKLRPNWDDYFMNITKQIAGRSTCMSFKAGAIVVKNKRIISTGYNGAPRKTLDCYDRKTCLRRELKIPSGHRYELCRSVHAEMNALINAARDGVSIMGGDMYLYGERMYNAERKLVTIIPCFICKKIIINAGIKNVISMTENGSIKKFSVEDWVNDWRTKDLLDDEDKYDSKYY